MRKPVAKPSSVAHAVVAERGSPGRKGRVVIEGDVVDVIGDDAVMLLTTEGRRVVCRCPLHVNVGWIKAALRVGPVAAEGTRPAGGGEGTIWALLPTPEQRQVVPEELSLVAASKLEIVCGKSKLALTKDGTIRLRGRDVATRGSRITRVQGGVVRVN